MRGRKPSLKKLMGKDEPKGAPLAVPKCPSFLKGEARDEWHRMTGLLYDLELIADLDRTTLAQHCSAWAQWVAAEKAIAKEGEIIMSPNKFPQPNPWLSIANQAAKQMQVLLSEFGLSPASRARLLAARKPKDDGKETGFEGVLANVG